MLLQLDMIDSIIQTLIKEKKPCYFISPHFDDAVFSAGALLTYLSQHTEVTIINVFTKMDKVSTVSAKMFLRQCGYTDPQKLEVDRKTEDAVVLEKIAKKVINLDFTDALWRKKYRKNFFSRLISFIPELQVIYPTYRFHIIKGMIAKEDLHTQSLIATKLKDAVIDQNAAIFCPLGIGNHVDHLITRKVCEDVFSKLIYWSDFPYNTEVKEEIKNFHSFIFDQYLDTKKQLIKEYKTQFSAVFKNGLVLTNEQFFIKQ